MIKTHGRPHSQHTLNALVDAGFPKKDIILMLDNEDDTIETYEELYGDDYRIVVFDKQQIVDIVDSGLRIPVRKVNTYAWQACELYAQQHNIKLCGMADDDITGFRYRYVENGSLKSLHITHGIDKVISEYGKWLENGNVAATAFGTNQMYMGGSQVFDYDKVINYRAPYNFIFRNMRYEFKWCSYMYEDTIVPVKENTYGKYTLQLPFVQLEMKDVDAGAQGGMSSTYSRVSDFKRIGSLLQYHPSCVRYIATNKKVTHGLYKDKAFPKLISSSCKKV